MAPKKKSQAPAVSEKSPVTEQPPSAPEIKAPEAPAEKESSAPAKEPEQAPAPEVQKAPVEPPKKELTPAEKKSAVNPEFKSADSSMIQCRIIQDVNAVIGKKRWVYKAGTMAKLPGSVYEVLKQAKKAI